MGTVIHQPAEFRELFYRHVVTVERDDVLIRVETASQPFLYVGSRDSVVGQLFFHSVCLHRIFLFHGFPKSPDSVAINISPDKSEQLLDTYTSRYE
ncbi:hypothetical protein [Bacteroides acidifaciens]|uniref:hypothetical protein n=1 Tax=Bacteroides acidifaciens TaxID=85831 RepID=UPI00259685F6|nr:hypothetical protein [uncultured Bacteroides sp.]